MATGRFDILEEKELRAILRAQADRPQDDRNDSQWSLAIDMLENRQLTHTKTALLKRYPMRQKLSSGEAIQPLTLPIAERYVAEAASAYSKTVTRKLVREDGSEDEEATKIYAEALEDIGADEDLNALERHTVMVEAAGLWPQAKRGEIGLEVVDQQRIWPVLPLDSRRCNLSDQRDYFGHVIELESGETPASDRQFVFVTPAAHYYYTSSEWSEVGKYEVSENSAFTWDQPQDTDDYRLSLASRPLQMLTIWHRVKPVGKLLVPTDCPIATMNLEMNVQWSAIMDTLRKQGWGQTFVNCLDPAKPPTQIAMGSGFAVPLGPGEAIGSFGHANDWGGMVELLKTLSRLFAVLLRQSPNDFAIDGASMASGFAKLVDSLPKLEARQDRVRRLKSMEEKFLWPRLGAILIYLGKLPESARQLKCRVQFANVEFPKTIAERAQEEDHDIKLGITTPAKILAKMAGISEEEAQAEIDENKGKAPQQEQPQQPGPMQQPGRQAQDIVSRIVASRSGLKPKQQGEPNA